MQVLTFTVEFELLRDIRQLAAPGPELGRRATVPSTTVVTPLAQGIPKVHLYFEPRHAMTCCVGNLTDEKPCVCMFEFPSAV